MPVNPAYPGSVATNRKRPTDLPEQTDPTDPTDVPGTSCAGPTASRSPDDLAGERCVDECGGQLATERSEEINAKRRAHSLGREYVLTMRGLAEATSDNDDNFFDMHVQALDTNARALERLDQGSYIHALLGIHDALLETFNELILQRARQARA